jgi:biotin synthase-like enzyme
MKNNELMEQAKKVYAENFPLETCFERAIFFSWHCDIRDCAYCFMSTQKVDDTKPKAVRSAESLLAELLICKKLGWDIGFISGGIGAFGKGAFSDLLKKMHELSGEKFWLNIGALNKETLKEYAPYTKGVVGSIETVNSKLHNNVCPSKPIEPYLEMFKEAEKLGLERAITIILGLGESEEDFDAFKNMITTYKISKVHLYGLNPQKGTVFETSKPPTEEYQAWWIAKARTTLPKLNIQCGIWEDRVDRISTLLEAGANSISKFPALKRFGTTFAKEIEKQAEKAGRKFNGTITQLPEIDWDAEINNLPFEDTFKLKIKDKLDKYLSRMKKNQNKE